MLGFADRMITKTVLRDQMTALSQVYGQLSHMYKVV
jgi:hypothetical protein